MKTAAKTGAKMRATTVALAVAVVASACGGTSDPAGTTSTEPMHSSTTQSSTESSTTSTTDSSQATTTTSVSSGPSTGGVGVDGQIGVVGCSNSAMAVGGYTDISDRDLLTEGGLTGGSLAVWGNEGPGRHDRYWGMYDDRRPPEGYAGTWFQMCIRTQEHQGSFDATEQEWIRHVVDEIRERDGDIPIWISGVNSYAEGVLCPSIGPDGAAIAAEAADWAAAELEGVERGPDLGPMLEEHRDPGDDCHPNGAGQAVLGAQLVLFFDGG